MLSEKFRHYGSYEERAKNASGLSRIFNHFQNGSFALVGAFKGVEKSQDNLRRAAFLGKDIRDLNYGFTPVRGVWKSTDSEAVYDEPSYYIPNCSFEHAEQLAKKYEQEAFIWGEKGEWFLYKTGDTKAITGGTSFNANFDKDVAEAYSEYKAKGFKLSSERSKIVNILDIYNKNRNI